MDAGLLMTETLRAHPRGAAVARVMAAALDAAEPEAAVRRHLRREGDELVVGSWRYDLAGAGRVVALAFGKAGLPMLRAAADALGGRLDEALAVVKGPAAEPRAEGGATVIEAGHPVPDERGAAAGRRALALLSGLGEGDLAVVLVSGGGSALLTSPAPGVTLADLQALTRELLACGATITEINTLRKHLDMVKGGGLLRAAGGARVAALVLSDVIGDPLDVIASGPLVADPSTYADALAVLERRGILGRAPEAAVAHLRRGLAGEAPETLKPGDPLLARAQHVLVGSGRLAAEAALAAAAAEGMAPLLLTTSLQGEAREVAQALAAIAREAAASGSPAARPCCIVAGGETTVTLRGPGRGGRNQELALAAAAGIAGVPGALVVALATDGDDGPTDAAGAVASGETVARAAALGLDPADHLARSDSYAFFGALGDLLRPGPTGTNVNDLTFIFVL